MTPVAPLLGGPADCHDNKSVNCGH